MRLNLKASDSTDTHYVTISSILKPGWQRLPHADRSISEFECIDFLNRVPMRLVPDVLKDIRRVLKPGASVTIQVLNFEYACRLFLDMYEADFEAAMHLIYGPQNPVRLYSGFTDQHLSRLLEEAGLGGLKKIEGSGVSLIYQGKVA